MQINLRRALLAGTALVAVTAFVAPGAAQAQTAVSAAATGTWSGDGTNNDDGTLAEAESGADLDITGDGVDIDVVNDQTADDSNGLDTFVIGDITDSSTAEDGDLDVTTGNATDLTVTINSAVLDGNVTVTSLAANDASNTTTVTDDLTVGGTLGVTTTADSDGDGATLNIGDNITVTGATTLTSTDGAGGAGGASITVDVAGTAVFTGAVTATTVGEGDVLINIAEDATFTGGLSIEETVAASAEGIVNVTLDGTVAQTITGSIDGATADEGTVTVTNTHASGVTFMDDVGSTAQGIEQISVNNDGNDQAVTFRDDISTDQGLLLGDNSGADTIAATIDAQDGAITTTGVVTGGASETVNLTVQGGAAVNQAAGAWTGIDSLTVTGTSTELDSDAAITATATTVASGATLDVGGGLLTSAVTLSGTLNLTGAGGVTGNVTGASGTLDVDADATVTGSVTGLDLIDVADNVTLTIDATTGNESVSATSILINDSGVDDGITFDLQGNTISLSSDVDTGTDGQGLVTIDDSAGTGTMTITSDIGSASAAMGVLAVSGAGSNETVTTTGNLYVDAITLDDADVLQFLGTSTQMVSGTISAANGTTDGVVTVGDGTAGPTVTFTGAVDVGGAFTANDDSMAIFVAAANDFDGAQSSDAATIQVNSTSDVTFASQTDADATTWNIGVKKTAGTQVVGQVVYSGDTVDLETTGADTVHFIVEANSQPLTVGASVLDNVFAGTGATAGLTDGATVTDNSFLYSFALVEEGNNVDVTVAQANSIDDTATTTTNANVGNMLITTLAASTNTQINQIQSNIQAAGTADAVNEILEAAAPTVDGGAVVGALNASGGTADVINTELASLRDAGTGVAAGNHSQGMRAWGRLFGQTADQDDRDGVDGYDADTLGVAVGVDTQNLHEDAVLGIAFSYADSDVESENATSTDTEVDSYQISLYGDMDLDDRTYVSGLVAYAFNDVETTRSNVGGVSGLTAQGDYDANQFTVRAEVGRDYAHGDTTLTPNALLHWTHYDADSYTETGAGGANLTVDQESLNVFEVGVGVDASWMFQNADGSYVEPEVRLGYRYDVVGDEVEANATFAGGGTSFKTEGFDPAQSTFDLGAGVTYFSTDNWELTADYDFTYKSDYAAHTGSLRAARKF